MLVVILISLRAATASDSATPQECDALEARVRRLSEAEMNARISYARSQAAKGSLLGWAKPAALQELRETLYGMAARKDDILALLSAQCPAVAPPHVSATDED